MTDTANPHRPIRSFVLRQGRITPAQQRALDAAWPAYGVDVDQDTPGPLDLDGIFGRRAPRVLEIGFGNGEQLLASAQAEPERDFLGIEVHRPGVGYLLVRAAAAGVANLRVINHDAVDVLSRLLPPDSLAEVRVLFPDPWPKTRQQKRRLIQLPFLALLATRLAPGGTLHLATDWENYAEQMLAVGDAAPDFRNVHGPGQYAPRPAWRVESRFERRGTKLGHGVWDLTYRRRDA